MGYGARSLRSTDPVVQVAAVYDDPIEIIGIPEKQSKAVTVKLGERNTVGEGPK